MASKLDLSSASMRGIRMPSGAAGVEPVKPVVSKRVHREVDRPQVTASIVDEAVENVLARVSYPPEVKDVLRKLLATDETSGFASSFYTGRADAFGRNLHPKLDKRVVNIAHVLTPEETVDLVSYAPEFDLKFHDQILHDHAMAAAMRKIDTELIMGMVPQGISLKDVGGDVMLHVDRATENVHVCDPYLDAKDPSRATVRAMKANRVVMDQSRSSASRDMAEAYLTRDSRVFCGLDARKCERRAKVTMSVHVYDVAMEDWPVIMEKAGAVMHVGVVLFPKAAFTSLTGVMPVARARYEVDVANNEFRMGFVGSSSWWYTHNWLQFMRYFSDQIILHEGCSYSYKVTEKRGDSLFFQIMKVEASATIQKQWYRMPTMAMVRVDGFEYVPGRGLASVAGRAPLRKNVNWFPAALWDDVYAHASMEFERGVMSYDKLYNYYRVVSPRNTINGVLISGGQTVSSEGLVSFITHVGMCAASNVMLMQRTSRAITSAEMSKRERSGFSLLFRTATLFWKSVQAAAKAISYYPLLWLAERFVANVNDALSSALVTWSYEPVVFEVPFSSVVARGGPSVSSPAFNMFEDVGDDTFRDFYFENQNSIANQQRIDGQRKKDRDIVKGLLEEMCDQGVSTAVDSIFGTTQVQTAESATTPPDGVATGVVADGVGKSIVESESSSQVRGSGAAEVELRTEVFHVDPQVVNMRRNAILEGIAEYNLEESKLLEKCEQIYRACMDVRGRPNESMLRVRSEEYFQPDFWYVRDGVIGDSVLGNQGDECRYPVLFTAVADPATNTRFRTVLEHTYDGTRSTAREYKIFSDTKFTGWALSIERLLIHNGPEVMASMQKAVDLDHNYKVVLEQAPPGSGKTYNLIMNLRDHDMAMCPVRESIVDTRKRVIQNDPSYPDPKHRICTLDSYLKNLSSSRARQILQAETLHADECYITHSSKWYAVAALLGVSQIRAYGDQFQIPHVSRVQAVGMYTKLEADETVVHYTTRRCPADAVAAWGHIYGYKIRSLSVVKGSMRVAVDASELQLQDGHVMLCMYQADKKALRRTYATQVKSKGLKIMTVHEAQGKTFDHVCLFRFDVRPRQDNTSLYDQQAYCLVAMSRHKFTFAYVRPKNLSDLVDTWIRSSWDPRAVAAALDVVSQGTAVRAI